MTFDHAVELLKVLMMAVVLSLQSPLKAETSIEFDVPRGDEEDIFDGALTPELVLTCKFAFAGKNTGTTRIPWVSLVFYAERPADENWDNVSQVALSTYRRRGSEFFRNPNRWHTVLYIGGQNIRDSSEEIATSDGRNPVHTMSLALLDDRNVQALVGERLEEPWIVDVSPIELKYWKVVVSGLRGWAFCNTSSPSEEEAGP